MRRYQAAHIFNPSAVPAFPTGLCQPWGALYRRRKRRPGMRIYGGRYLTAMALAMPFIVIYQVAKIVYGTIIWAIWVYLVASVWLVIACYSYLASVLWRTADYLLNRNRNRNR